MCLPVDVRVVPQPPPADPVVCPGQPQAQLAAETVLGLLEGPNLLQGHRHNHLDSFVIGLYWLPRACRAVLLQGHSHAAPSSCRAILLQGPPP